jgi:Zn-finger nucleic acid-binding protein
MACPNDGTTLVMSERQGIEIDYCPTCRGVWLDRGELDKIIERSGADQTAGQPSFAPQQPGFAPQQPAYPPQQPGYPPQQHGYGHYKHKRRKSFLEELFD